MAQFFDIPADVVADIWKYLSYIDLTASMRSVSKAAREMVPQFFGSRKNGVHLEVGTNNWVVGEFHNLFRLSLISLRFVVVLSHGALGESFIDEVRR